MAGQVWSAEDVGRWMAAEVAKRSLYQKHVAYEIRTKFGPEFTYKNKNGNWGIDPKVLAVFRGLTEGNVVWERGARRWRVRQPWDPPGRGRN